jgi:hypothetical protein
MFFPAALALAACQTTVPAASEDGATAGRLDQAGTCFAIVRAEEDGQYSISYGVADGSREPKGKLRGDLSAAEVDAAFAAEVATMQVSPECLGTYTRDRSTTKAPAGT